MKPIVELLGGIALAAAAVYFVLRPILFPSPQPSGQESGASDPADDPEDDLSRSAVALRALREIEFDRATGKLADADYDALKRQYTAAALAALRETEPAEVDPHGNVRRSPGLRVPGPVCPTHGPRPESGPMFCSECGRRLEEAPGY
ncbi:MAG: hypothetical protein ACREMF_01075, partial [Gemmatimonadales bacterium]